ncbi:MAG: preprotein translocase subunit SecG [Candidatus Hydrothermia bacterium]
MYTFLTILYVILVLILIGVVLLQEPREGGMSPALGGMQQLLGVRGVPTFFTRLTWGLGALFIILSLVLATINNPARVSMRGQKQKAEPVQETQQQENKEIPQLPGEGR